MIQSVDDLCCLELNKSPATYWETKFDKFIFSENCRRLGWIIQGNIDPHYFVTFISWFKLNGSWSIVDLSWLIYKLI